jgi:hypothetical protein
MGKYKGRMQIGHVGPEHSGGLALERVSPFLRTMPVPPVYAGPLV